MINFGSIVYKSTDLLLMNIIVIWLSLSLSLSISLFYVSLSFSLSLSLSCLRLFPLSLSLSCRVSALFVTPSFWAYSVSLSFYFFCNCPHSGQYVEAEPADWRCIAGIPGLLQPPDPRPALPTGTGIGAQAGEPPVHEEADRLHAGPETLWRSRQGGQTYWAGCGDGPLRGTLWQMHQEIN